jgi:hypothetical protein
LPIAILACSAEPVAAQSIVLEYQQAVTRALPGATAAFSLNPDYVGASAYDGVLSLVGRAPGTTHVVVLFGDRSESFLTTVKDSRPEARAAGASFGADANEAGSLELRYASRPAVLQNRIQFGRRQGDRQTDMTFAGAVPFGGVSQSPFSIPTASYSVRTPSRELTVLDESVTNSPLTLSRSNVRGVHIRQGNFRIHAGYSFFANYEDVLLPTHKETVGGVSYRIGLGTRSSLTPNIYYFGGNVSSVHTGTLGSLVYETRPAAGVKLLVEVAKARAVGTAIDLDIDRANDRAWAKVRIAPQDLPSLSTGQLNGRAVDAAWLRNWKRIGLNANVSSHSYAVREVSQTSSVASLGLQYRLAQHWAVQTAPGYSLFDSGSAAGRLRSTTAPVGFTFSKGLIGLGGDYQFTRDADRDRAGHLVRATVRGGSGRFQLWGMAERQTQAPTTGYILSQVPQLQETLDRMGIAASSPQQIAELLQTNAGLAALGYSGLKTVNLTPVRLRFNGGAVWTGSGPRRPTFRFDSILNHDSLIDRTVDTAVHSVTYSYRVNGATEVFASASWICAAGPSRACNPVMSLSLRQPLTRMPRLLVAERRGDIQGIVFIDDLSRGAYGPGLTALPGIDVVLDGARHTRTDAAGRYRFTGVPYGQHRVEVPYKADGSFFYTTPSPADVVTGSTADFGIGFTRSRLRVLVGNDAGAALPDVVVRLRGADGQGRGVTGGDGAFTFAGLAEGEYEVVVDPASVPPGYALEALSAQRVKVSTASVGVTQFVLVAHRSVTGAVRIFDRVAGRYLAVKDAVVELGPQRSVTDERGVFLFRDVPAGPRTVVVHYDGTTHDASVSLPQGPAAVKDITFSIVPGR